MIHNARKVMATFGYQSLDFAHMNNKLLWNELIMMAAKAPPEDLPEITEMIESTVSAIRIQETMLDIAVKAIAILEQKNV